MQLDNLQRVRAFLAVAETLNITRASTQLHIAQPAVSRYIHDLEESIGLPLFKRISHGVMLTEAGHALIPSARGVIAAAGEMEMAVESINTQIAGHLRVAASSTWPKILSDALPQFANSYPNVRVTVRISDVREVLDLVRRDEVHIGLLGSTPKNDEFAVLSMGKAEMVIVAVPTHPLAKAGLLRGSDLKEPLHFAHILHPVLQSYLRAAGITYTTKLDISDLEMERQAVLARMGLGFMLKFALREELASGDLVQIRLRAPACMVTVDAIHNPAKALTKTQRAFLAQLEAPLRKAGLKSVVSLKR